MYSSLWRFVFASLFLVSMALGMTGCSSSMSEDAALEQVQEADRVEAEEEEGGMEEDEFEANLDAEE